MSSHLYVRSAYSLLQATMPIDRIVALAKTLEFDAIGLCDRHVMHGALEFLDACQHAQLKPILGLEVDVAIDQGVYPFLLIALNTQGYRRLLSYSSRLKTQSTSLVLSDFERIQNDVAIIALSAEGYFDEAFIDSNSDALQQRMRFLHQTLPFIQLGLTHHEHAFFRQQNERLIQCAQLLNMPVLATPKVLYGDADEDELLRVVKAIDTQRKLDDENLVLERHRYLLSPRELEETYPKEALKATADLIAKVSAYEVEGNTYLPQFETPDGLSSAHYLTQLCLTGLEKRYESTGVTTVHRHRLKMELDVITAMHFEDYFLIVWDFIRFAKRQGIYVGPGRGSAAGSLVAYSLGITHVDPIEHVLLFERFLNPERISLPDIDTDFPDNRRDEVIQYVYEKYGSDHVAHICTFGTLGAKQVLRDVGRVMDISPRELDGLSKTIPNTPKITLAKAYAQNARFRQLVASDERFQKLYSTALRLEGLPRHVSTHAAGIVMSSEALSQVVPMIQLDAGMVSTQYSMDHLERLGLIKMDFLGLRNLTIIDEVVQAINAERPDALNILRLPLDDAKTLALIRAVDTVGIFQLESEGMKQLLRQMQTQHFDDIVATIALFRPGPMENIPEYLRARQQGSGLELLHEDLRPIVAATHGILIYQEQIMQVAQKMAGFTLARADVLRKAMSKKDALELVKMQAEFIQGCVQQGYAHAMAEALYRLIEKFANYGFNKSHSVAYALISYQMAYLKANHTAHFMVALLNSVIGSETKTFEYLQEAKQHRIPVLNPSINASTDRYHLEHDAIRFPLLVIKGIGGVVARAIQLERNQGEFKDFYDCVVRLSAQKVSKNHFEALIDAGALDEFKRSRATLLASLSDALTYADMIKVEHHQQIIMDRSLVEPLPLIVVKDLRHERLERERQVLGFYLSEHPISDFKAKLELTHNLSQFKPSSQRVRFVAMVKKIKPHRTKTGAMMAFVNVYDETMEFDCVLMPQLYDHVLDKLVVGSVVRVEGVIEKEQSCLVKDLDVIPYQ
jgi:DNA polymerase-3 subunit alpha